MKDEEVMVHGVAYPDGAARPEGRDTGEAITGIDLEFIWKNTSAPPSRQDCTNSRGLSMQHSPGPRTDHLQQP